MLMFSSCAHTHEKSFENNLRELMMTATTMWSDRAYVFCVKLGVEAKNGVWSERKRGAMS